MNIMEDVYTLYTKEQYYRFYEERFVYPNEFHRAIKIIEKESFSLLITGPTGVGKSTLLQLLTNRTSDKIAKEIVCGRNLLSNDFSLLETNSDCLFLDGLDEAQNPDNVLAFINAKGYKKLICTSRNKYLNKLFTDTITLDGLTNAQVNDLLLKLQIDNRMIHSISANSIINASPITPRDILRLISSKSNPSESINFLKNSNDLLYQFGSGVGFGSNDINSIREEIIVPPKRIITQIATFEESLLQKARQSPHIIYDFTPREFEKFICQLLDAHGMQVKLTKQTRDGGKDLIVIQKSVLGEFLIYVECKKYDARRPISVKIIRELYGTIMAESVTAGLLITTSYFSKDAQEFTEKIKNRMNLMDYSDLVESLNGLYI